MPQSPMKRSTELIATAPSLCLRLQAASQGCGQTRPITAGNGLVSTSICQAWSQASSRERPCFSRWAMTVSQPRMSLPLGQCPTQGGSLSTAWGRSGEISDRIRRRRRTVSRTTFFLLLLEQAHELTLLRVLAGGLAVRIQVLLEILERLEKLVVLLLVDDQVVQQRALHEERALFLELLGQLDGLVLDLVVRRDLVPDLGQLFRASA